MSLPPDIGDRHIERCIKLHIPLRCIKEFHTGQSWQRLTTTQPHCSAPDSRIKRHVDLLSGLLFVCLITSFILLTRKAKCEHELDGERLNLWEKTKHWWNCGIFALVVVNVASENWRGEKCTKEHDECLIKKKKEKEKAPCWYKLAAPEAKHGRDLETAALVKNRLYVLRDLWMCSWLYHFSTGKFNGFP